MLKRKLILDFAKNDLTDFHNYIYIWHCILELFNMHDMCMSILSIYYMYTSPSRIAAQIASKMADKMPEMPVTVGLVDMWSSGTSFATDTCHQTPVI